MTDDSNISQCLSETDLERFHSGEMLAAQAGRVDAHIRSCESCGEKNRVFLEEMDSFLKDLRKVAGKSGGIGAPFDSKSPGFEAGAAPRGLSVVGYELTREIHRGGQGVVYEAIQQTTKRKVAIKVLLEGPSASVSARKRFEREIEVIAGLRHSNIVTIFDTGRTADGRDYYVMDYVTGQSLDDYVRGRQSPLIDTLQLFVRIGRAMDYAHELGVVHRDLKPSNVMVDEQGNPRIMDFGLAKALDQEERTMVSMTGQVFGTLPYMSPEQASGLTNEIDGRCDVYALGVMLYELLVGRYPYDITGPVTTVLKTICETPPERPSKAWRVEVGVTTGRTRSWRSGTCPIDDDLETILLKCLNKEQDRRYQTAGDLAEDIERYLAGKPILARRSSHWYVIKKSLPRHKAMIAGLAAILIAATATLIVTRERAESHRRLTEERSHQRDALLEQCRDAVMLMDDKRLDKLLDAQAEQILPANLMHCFRGYAHLIRLDDAKSMEEADKAIKLDPKHGESYLLRAAIHAFRIRLVDAGLDLAKSQQFRQGTALEMALQGMIKGMLGQVDAAQKEIDELVAQQHGSAAVLFVRGFFRWLWLWQKAPYDMKQREQLALAAMEDLTAAGTLYPTVAYMFDVRADVGHWLYWISRSKGELDKAKEYMDVREKDALHMVNLGATANGKAVLSAIELVRGNAVGAYQFANEGLNFLMEGRQRVAANKNSALVDSLGMVMHSGVALGREKEAMERAREVYRLNPEVSGIGNVWVVDAMTADPADLLERVRKQAPQSVGYQHDLVSQWTGCMLRGDEELARKVANCYEGGLMDRWQWQGIARGFMQGKRSARELRDASTKLATEKSYALFITAMAERSREARLKKLQLVLDNASADNAMMWSVVFMRRAQDDPHFLEMGAGSETHR
jgi:serine/threonine protein kinase